MIDDPLGSIPLDGAGSGLHARSSRRAFFASVAGAGIGSTVFARALWAQSKAGAPVTPEVIRSAEWVAGLTLTDEQRTALGKSLEKLRDRLDPIRKVPLDNSVPPALHFLPHAVERTSGTGQGARRSAADLRDWTPPARPASDVGLAFLPVSELAPLIRSRTISSVELTRLSLDRLAKHDPVLKCVITLTEKTALEQAERADREIAAGRYRGPLHGIPWGAKDLIAWPGYPTTWGAMPFKEQRIERKATVARRLEEAGAVLVAKLTLGAIAQGDRWFGGVTRNPWNPKQGSSGSSAGSASATAAGLVPFALGSETLGSIVSPSRRCGNTGLRPTFGRVSRDGCMALSWSMDKIGPITRSAEDAALVFAAIHGADGLDPTAIDRPFQWPPRRDLSTLRVGYFETDADPVTRTARDVLMELGLRLVPIKLPKDLPEWPLTIILQAESAAAFDELTRRGVTEGLNTWPGYWREGMTIPAVDYLRANRVRTLLMRQMAEVMETVDLYLGGDDLVLTNLTGHPSLVMPGGFRSRGDAETPVSISLTGRLFGEEDLLAVGAAFQRQTGHHLRRPPIDSWLPVELAE